MTFGSLKPRLLALSRKHIAKIRTSKNFKSVIDKLGKKSTLASVKAQRLFATTPHQQLVNKSLSKSVLGVRHELRKRVSDRLQTDKNLFTKSGMLHGSPAAAKYFIAMSKSKELPAWRQEFTNPLRIRKTFAREIRRDRKKHGTKAIRAHYRNLAESFRAKYLK